MKNWHKLLLANLAALLLGMAVTFAFAPYAVFPLALLGPAGLLALWLNASPKQAFWQGFSFGIGFFGLGVYWIFISIHQYGDVSDPIAALITGGLISALAAFPALVGYVTKRYFPANTTPNLIYAFPAIWVFSEWFRSWLFSGFPWLFLGYSQTNSPLKGFAPIFSVYGVSLAVVMSGALIVNSALKFKEKNYQSLYYQLLACIFIWLTGAALSLIPWTNPYGKPITVSLVQGNIPQSLKWSPDHLKLSFDRYTQLTKPLWGKSQFIIWPEAAIPLPMQNAMSFIGAMDQQAQQSHSELILGIPVQNPDGSGYYNALLTLGQNKEAYLKRHLVPFGEYIPNSPFISRAFDFMHIPISNLLSGKLDQAPFTFGDVKILPAICFEITFPDLMLSRDPTIGLLLTVTNDAWFGDSPAQAQHLQMAAMRAIEFQRPVLFASNDGTTAIIGPDGQVTSTIPPHQTGVLTGTVQPMNGLTPWMRNGTDPIHLIMLILLVAAIRAKLNARANLQSLNGIQNS